MGEIYSTAEEVVAWLGDNFVPAALRRTNSGKWEVPATCAEFSDAGDNPHWGRVWIVQEVVTAKKGRILYGDISIDLDILFAQLHRDASESFYKDCIATTNSLRKSKTRKDSL